MHESLVHSCDPEGRKILLEPPTVVDHGVRVGWAVSIVMDELIKVQVAEQPYVSGVVDMSSQCSL